MTWACFCALIYILNTQHVRAVCRPLIMNRSFVWRSQFGEMVYAGRSAGITWSTENSEELKSSSRLCFCAPKWRSLCHKMQRVDASDRTNENFLWTYTRSMKLLKRRLEMRKCCAAELMMNIWTIYIFGRCWALFFRMICNSNSCHAANQTKCNDIVMQMVLFVTSKTAEKHNQNERTTVREHRWQQTNSF